MLAEQRERMNAFLGNINLISEKEGMPKVEELLKTTARTIRYWIKGEREPVSSSFDQYEKTLQAYISKTAVYQSGTEQATNEGETGSMSQTVETVETVQAVSETAVIETATASEVVAVDTAEVKTEQEVAVDSQTGHVSIPLSLIDPNPYQPRKHFDEEALVELSKSIEESGLLQSPVVRKVGDRYQLIAGERRTRAVKLLGWTEMMVNVVVMTDAEVATAALVENLQRQDVSQLSTARAIDRMVRELGVKQGEIAEKLGVTQAKISQLLALLKLSEANLERLEKGEISPSIGRMLGTLPTAVQDTFDADRLAKGTAKSIQENVNGLKTMLGALEEELKKEDALRNKFAKFMYQRNLLDLQKMYDYGRNTLATRKDNDSINFEATQYNSFGHLRMNKKLEYLVSMLNKPYVSRSLSLKFIESNKEVMKAVYEFMEEYCPYEEIIEEPKEQEKGQKVEEPKEPAAPRLTKEQKEELRQQAEEKSPIAVLAVTTGKTKSERLLQRIQEHQGEEMHELTQRCYNCRFFKPDAESYTERCSAQYGFNLGQLDRFKIEGKPDLFLCHKYSPTDEQIEKEKVEGLDPEIEMLRLLLNLNSYLGDLHRLMPEMAGKNHEELIEAYKGLDAKSKAYMIYVISQKVSLHKHDAKQRYIQLPDGKRIVATEGHINGAEDI